MSQIKIAVIDDATMIRDLIKKFIRQNFTNATTYDANNGQTGMALLKKQPVDLILCDWEMPEMNGEELLRWAREQDSLKNTPFIMVTSRGDKEFVMKAIQSGVSDYLVKPFNTKQFQEKVSKALKRHGVNIQVGKSASPLNQSDSVSVLIGGTSQVKPTKRVKSSTSKQLPKGIAILRTANGEVKCALQQMDLKSMVGIFKVSEYLPNILDQVSVDMEFNKDGIKKVMRINGYIQMLKSKDENVNSEMIQTKVFFMDEDPEKRLLISEYVGQFS